MPFTQSSSQLIRCPSCKKPLRKRSTHCYACGSRVIPMNELVIRPSQLGSMPATPKAPKEGETSSRLVQSYTLGASNARDLAIPEAQHPNDTMGLQFTAFTSPVTEEPEELEDVARVPTRPQADGEHLGLWYYNTSGYAIESSVALSLMIPEVPTQPEFPNGRVTHHLSDIEEIDTQPTGREELTLSVPGITGHLSLPSVTGRFQGVEREPQARVVPVTPPLALDVIQHDEGEITLSSQETYIPQSDRQLSHFYTLNPLDQVRWWLLRPGRMEFLLWIVGTLLLIVVTCVIILLSAFTLTSRLEQPHHSLFGNAEPDSRTRPTRPEEPTPQIGATPPVQKKGNGTPQPTKAPTTDATAAPVEPGSANSSGTSGNSASTEGDAQSVSSPQSDPTVVPNPGSTPLTGPTPIPQPTTGPTPVPPVRQPSPTPATGKTNAGSLIPRPTP